MLRPRRRRRRRRAICRNPTACLPSRSCLHLRFLTDSPTCVPHYYATVGRSFAHARTRRTQKSVGRGRSVSPRTRPSHDLMTVTIAPIGSALGPSTRSTLALASIERYSEGRTDRRCVRSSAGNGHSNGRCHCLLGSDSDGIARLSRRPDSSVRIGRRSRGRSVPCSPHYSPEKAGRSVDYFSRSTEHRSPTR